MAAVELFTIGHSSHSLERFLALLGRHRIERIADVRSRPYSGRNPQYNREVLAEALDEAGVEYLFLGRELGARREEKSCYLGGKLKYERIAALPIFRRGIERVCTLAAGKRTALMCAERDPAECHRARLVCANLEGRGIDITHILADGGCESHATLQARFPGGGDGAERQIDLFD